MTRGLKELGITVADLQEVQRLPFPQAQKMLASLKDRAKQNFRRLIKELHPDTNGGDAVKTEWLRILILVKAELDKIEVPAPRPPVRHVPTPMIRQQPAIGVRWVNPKIEVDVKPMGIRSKRTGV